MRKLQRGDVKDIIEYERVRDAFRQHVIEVKRSRRVSVGPSVTLVFENRDTVLFQIEEMMRAERIVQEDKVQEEINIYNDLLPGRDELSATLFIEITNKRRIKLVLDRMMGIDQGEKVWIEFGDERVAASFEQGRSNDEKISAVHFVQFRFTPQQSRRFRSGEDAAMLVVRHNTYRHKTPITDDVRKSLSKDLES